MAAEYAKAAAAEEEAEAVTEPETETETEAEPVPSAAPVEASAIDNRSIIGNWTFTGRTEIWQSGLIAISEDMGMMLKGGNSKDLMVSINHILTTRVNPTVTEYKYHMHNSYLMVLMLLGLPGFLLIMLWTVMMVIKMVKLFFSKKAGLADKYLTVPLAGVFVVSLAESFIFTAHDTVGLIFYLYAGVFLARSYEIMKD